MAAVASFADVSIPASALSDPLSIMASRRKAVFDDMSRCTHEELEVCSDDHTAIGTLGLAACGDDTKSPALPATTPVAVVTSAMVDNTTAMVDNTTAMVDNTTAMVDGSTATTGG